MKYYIVGYDGSCGEYGASVVVKDVLNPENSQPYTDTKLFTDLERAKKYCEEIGERGFAIIGEVEEYET